MLRSNFFSDTEVAAIVRDFHNANLKPEEVAMMAFAQKVVSNPAEIAPADIEELRMHGFSDEQILDITLAASARSFFSKALDALGAEPDPIYMELNEDLRQALTVGRPIE